MCVCVSVCERERESVCVCVIDSRETFEKEGDLILSLPYEGG